MSEIIVTPWGTRQALPNDPSAPMHSALWNVATEQAILARIKETGEDWATAAKHVSDEQIIEHLDAICDENNFRRLDGSGTGRDPNVINDGERIQVRIDPRTLTEPVKGVDHKTPTALDAYNKSVSNPGNTDWDSNKKERLDAYLGSIPGFETLPDGSKAALIEAYGREGVDTQRLATLAGSDLFQKNLDAEEQKRLLASYGVKGKELVTGEVDKLATTPVTPENALRLKVMSTPGFGTLNASQQRAFLDRLSEDGEFRAGVSTIIGQPNFKDKSDVAQGHALDILRCYSSRKGPGYGEIDGSNRRVVLKTLYNDVLAKPEFKLHEVTEGTQQSPEQTRLINEFADHKAKNVKGP